MLQCENFSWSRKCWRWEVVSFETNSHRWCVWPRTGGTGTNILNECWYQHYVMSVEAVMESRQALTASTTLPKTLSRKSWAMTSTTLACSTMLLSLKLYTTRITVECRKFIKLLMATKSLIYLTSRNTFMFTRPRIEDFLEAFRDL